MSGNFYLPNMIFSPFFPWSFCCDFLLKLHKKATSFFYIYFRRFFYTFFTFSPKTLRSLGFFWIFPVNILLFPKVQFSGIFGFASVFLASNRPFSASRIPNIRFTSASQNQKSHTAKKYPRTSRATASKAAAHKVSEAQNRSNTTPNKPCRRAQNQSAVKKAERRRAPP